jgi:hypothetical protein
MKYSLILEAMEDLGAPPIHYQSTLVAGFVAQSLPKASHMQESSKTEKVSFLGVAVPLKPIPQQGLLRQGFLNFRSSMKGTSSPLFKSLIASSSTMVVAVKGEDSNLNRLTQSHHWPVGFDPSRENSPKPLNIYHPKGFSLPEVLLLSGTMGWMISFLAL